MTFDTRDMNSILLFLQRKQAGLEFEPLKFYISWTHIPFWNVFDETDYESLKQVIFSVDSMGSREKDISENHVQVIWYITRTETGRKAALIHYYENENEVREIIIDENFVELSDDSALLTRQFFDDWVEDDPERRDYEKCYANGLILYGSCLLTYSSAVAKIKKDSEAYMSIFIRGDEK